MTQTVKPPRRSGPRGATLRDLAVDCDCDVSTVSRALQGDTRLSLDTRQRVLEAAKARGYRPNLAARNLVTGRTGTIWMLCSWLSAIQNHLPAQSAADHVRSLGLDLLVAIHHGDVTAHERLLERLRQQVCDGALIIADSQDLRSDLLVRLHQDGFPLVFIDRHRPDLPVPAVSSENAAACTQLVTLAKDAGARSVISLFNDHNTVECARGQGTRDATLSFGLEMQVDVLKEPYAVLGSGEGEIREWCKGKPTPVMVGTFDAWDSDPFPNCQTWKVIQDFPTMARLAADLLCKRIAGNPVEPSLRLVPVSGIIRVE